MKVMCISRRLKVQWHGRPARAISTTLARPPLRLHHSKKPAQPAFTLAVCRTGSRRARHILSLSDSPILFPGKFFNDGGKNETWRCVKPNNSHPRDPKKN